jgi:hypothetical protein
MNYSNTASICVPGPVQKQSREVEGYPRLPTPSPVTLTTTVAIAGGKREGAVEQGTGKFGVPNYCEHQMYVSSIPEVLKCKCMVRKEKKCWAITILQSLYL